MYMVVAAVLARAFSVQYMYRILGSESLLRRLQRRVSYTCNCPCLGA
jgi:hypothetical protein